VDFRLSLCDISDDYLGDSALHVFQETGLALTKGEAVDRNPVHIFVLVLGLMLALTGLPFVPESRADDAEVDLVLVLAVDCSYSVDASEFRLQMQGLADAFRRSDIQEAIGRGANGRIAVVVMEWSDIKDQQLLGPWAVLDTPASALALAERIGTSRRELTAGGTAIGDALRFAGNVLLAAPFRTDRHVIDISSDGRNNRGDLVSNARDEVAAKGITINGMPILSEYPTLAYYFEQQVIGGPNHFMIPVRDYNSFATAIARKLLQEITGPGIS
jgi:Protein of unknown function (DUF1194)